VPYKRHINDKGAIKLFLQDILNFLPDYPKSVCGGQTDW